MADTRTAMRRACCGAPLIPTMKFSGAEYYCRTCRNIYGMMVCPEEVEMTTEMQALFDADVKWFRGASKDCIPRGARYGDCDQCQHNCDEPHSDHAATDALEKSRRAYAALLR